MPQRPKSPDKLPVFRKRLESKEGRPAPALERALATAGTPTDIIQGIRELASMKLRFGSFKTEATGWYKIEYDAYPETPTVLALSKYRGEARSWSEKWLDEGQFALYSQEKFERVAREGLGDWGAFEVLKAPIIWLAGALGYVSGLVFGLLINLALAFTPNIWYIINRLPSIGLDPAPIKEIRTNYCVVLGHADSELFLFVIGPR